MAVFLLSSAAVAVCAFAKKGDFGGGKDMHSMSGTVYYDGGYSVVLGKVDCERGVACGFFKDTLNQTGWGILEVATTRNGSVPDSVRMYGAGILEGFLTSFEIYRNFQVLWTNEEATLGPYYRSLNEWHSQQREWANDMIASNRQSAYWQFASLLFNQFDGMIEGYHKATRYFGTNNLPAFANPQWAFALLSGHLEFMDVRKHLNASENIQWQSLSPKHALNAHLNSGHCSAIVKVTPKLDDILFSHNTWSHYYTSNRIYKFYHLPLQNRHAVGERLTMPSYPGSMSSIDDWYQMDSGVIAMETTNSVYRTELFELLKPQSMYVWQRTRISSFVAATAKEWVETMGRYNSGTYNNQWIALHYGAFEAEKPLPDELLMIGEQLPGAYVIEDMTKVLERGYFPSYNVPATDEIYELSGTADIIKTKGVEFSYDMCPRARLYRAYANEANDIESMQKFMQYNDYKNDPLQNGYSNWAIASRYDLHSNRVPDQKDFGCIDTKISSLADMRSCGTWIKGSPTFDNQPVFSWNDWPKVYHQYLPTNYDFGWIYVKPIL